MSKKIPCGNTPTSRPSGPDTPWHFPLCPTPIPLGVPFCTSKDLLHSRPWQPIHCYRLPTGLVQAAHILGFIDAQSRGIHPNVGKIVIGHKLYRQQIPLKESPGNALALVQMSPIGDPSHEGLGLPERRLVRN